MRPEIRSVIHAHPPTGTAFAAASAPLDQLQLPEMLVLLGPVAFGPYATPGSEMLAGNLAQALPDHDAFLLENHGALTLGRTVRQAALRMDLLEQNARISLLVRQLGRPFTLAAADREILLGFRQRMALWGCDPFVDPDR
jgi:L-fuculose-phosphate aldolase